jgi:hypothetical protein
MAAPIEDEQSANNRAAVDAYAEKTDNNVEDGGLEVRSKSELAGSPRKVHGISVCEASRLLSFGTPFR